ncbi:MAG: 5-formyltetrahydrofolate cyclo-ligase [Candidatus Omnitrophica bacterium]|nr:5-formyltetrahydrofolate cyclo-ligase [Candidatus Omnitrophota bacterium]
MSENSQDNTILLSKRKIRKEISSQLRSQEKKQILENSAAIKRRLFDLEEFKKARCVVFYVSMETEVNTYDMIDESIQMGKRVGVPVVVEGEGCLNISQINSREKELKKGFYGVGQPEAKTIRPIPCEDMELVLVPGIAFDKAGNRLGRGKGYYDKFLKGLPKRALTIGLCFNFQVVESIPRLPHDIPVKMLLAG